MKGDDQVEFFDNQEEYSSSVRSPAARAKVSNAASSSVARNFMPLISKKTMAAKRADLLFPSKKG